MKFESLYSHHGAQWLWDSSGRTEWLKKIFNEPFVEVKKGNTQAIRKHIERELSSDGWVLNPLIDKEMQLSITAQKGILGFQIQTGNISRAAYDLLKLQNMYLSHEIDSGCLAVPTHKAAKSIGSNLANSERLIGELKLFDRHITVPILLVDFS